MSTISEVQVSSVNVNDLVRQINAAVDAGRDITVNGDVPIHSFESDAARAYMNGTLSYRVAAKKKGATREVFVKVGHMVTISSEAPADQAPAPHATVKPSKAKAAPKSKATKATTSTKPERAVKAKDDGKSPIVASVKGETGYLSVRTVDGHYRYAVTMDEKSATRFAPGGSTERHAKRAEAAGITLVAA